VLGDAPLRERTRASTQNWMWTTVEPELCRLVDGLRPGPVR
jgi:hypothetical protein